MDLQEEISRMAEGKLADPSHFIVDVIVSTRKGPVKILVLLDGDKGITIDDCANLSRELSKAINDAELIAENYTLEISTPGLDHPLKLKRQYLKNIGRGMKVKLHDRSLEGELAGVSDEKIVLTQETGSGKKKETKSVEIPFSDIEKAFVLVSFK